MNNSTGVKGVLLACSVGLMPMAHSQDEAAASRGPDRAVLEEIMVTAQKRTENIQETPLSITALSGDALEARNIDDVFGYGELVPNLTVNPTMGSATAASVFIRGQGAGNFEAYVDSPVATYIDGVIYPRPNVANLEVSDIERVEVLRGPQGTLFGRNTTGGAISITTRAPSKDFGFKQSLQYGSDDEITAKSIIDTGQLGEHFTSKIVYLHHQRDGWVKNLSQGATYDGGYRRSDSINFVLHGELTSQLSMDYRFDYTDLEGVMAPSQPVYAGADYVTYFGNSPALGGEPFNLSPGPLSEMYIGAFGPEKNKSGGHSLNLEYALSDTMMIKNLLAYRGSRTQSPNNNTTGQGLLRGLVLDPLTGDVSVQTVKPFNAGLFIEAHHVSEEVQLLGEVGAVKYVAGLYYYKEQSRENNPLFLTAVLPGGTLGLNLFPPREFTITSKSQAAFLQGTYAPPLFNDKLQVTLGGRYTKDDRSLDEPTINDSDSWSEFSYSAGLQYQWTPNFMTFLRVADAYKAGGYTPGFAGSYNPEYATSFELGFKSDWLDNRLRLNVTGYQTDYKDLQLQQTIAGIPQVTNAGESTFTGAELELTAVPTSRLRLNASVGYIDPEFDVYMYSDPVLGQINVADEVRMTYAADFNYTVGLDYDFIQRSSSSLSGRIDFHYESRRYYFPLDRALPYNELISGPPIESLRAGLTWNNLLTTSGGMELSASVWGDNLLDKVESVTGSDWTPLDFATVVFSRPRTYGIGIEMKF